MSETNFQQDVCNPYRAPSGDCQPLLKKNSLVCPHCEVAFELTWRMYIRERKRLYRCPHCGRVSRLLYTPKYFFKAIFWSAVWIGGASVPLFFNPGPVGFALAGCLFPLAIWADFALDRRHDCECPLVPIANESVIPSHDT